MRDTLKERIGQVAKLMRENDGLRDSLNRQELKIKRLERKLRLIQDPLLASIITAKEADGHHH